MKRRLLAALMCVCMIIGLIPATAMAKGNGGRAGDTYDAYYYMLKPEFKDNATSTDTQYFDFVGRGSVSGIGAPPQDNEIKEINKGTVIAPQTETQTFSGKSFTTYPNITVGDTTYVYEGRAGNDPSQPTYSIQWYRFSSSDGFNIGDDRYQIGPCWHVDGLVLLNDKVSVQYKVQFPKESNFSFVDGSGNKIGTPYAVYKNEGTTFDKFAAPKMPDKTGYVFDGWYSKQNFSAESKITDNTEINDNMTVYGRYVAQTDKLKIKMVVDGNSMPFVSGQWNQYISNVTGAGETTDVTTRVVGDYLEVTYSYGDFNAADLKITPASKYVLQGVSGTFISNNGWNEPVQSGAGWVIDNVAGNSELTIYLSTNYTVKYYLDGKTNGKGTDGYIAVKKLETAVPPNFTGDSSGTSSTGSWINGDLKTTLQLDQAPPSYPDAWYILNDQTSSKHTSPYTGATISVMAGATKDPEGQNTPTIIECYAFSKQPEYTITVNVTNGTAKYDDSTVTAPITVQKGDSAAISFAPYTDTTYALDSVTVNGSAASLTNGAYTFNNVASNQTINVVYAVDEIGGGQDLDEPDGIADKYQVTINYVAGEGGSLKNPEGDLVQSPSSSVVTIRNEQGKPISAGSVKIVNMQAVPDSTHFFVNWTKKVNNGTETQYTIKQTLGGTLQVTGGTVVTFTANFDSKTYEVDVNKTVTNDQEHNTLAIVGDTLSYTIKVTNNSNVALENAVLTDSMWGAGKVTSVQVSGIADPVDVSNGSYNITNLNLGGTITITYDYTVSKADLDKDTQSGLISNEALVKVNGQTVGRDTAETKAIGDLIITPANITIYTGGAGYDQVVDENGNVVSDQNGLPVPGFYVSLPTYLDQLLKTAARVDVDDTLDLSGYLTFGNGDKSWSLALYDGDNTHKVDGKYIYRLVAAGGQDPVRMQFTDRNNVTHVDDELNLQNALYSEYTMEIYPGNVDPGTVRATLKTGKGDFALPLEAKTGTLTIRGVTEEGDTNEVTHAVTAPVNEVTAEVPEGTTYKINGSDILAVNPQPALLVDNIAASETSEILLTGKALDTLNLSSLEGLSYEFRYLDLVDTANGNTWLTSSNPVTVYWPIPENAAEDATFYLVHFEGLDREMSVAGIESAIEQCQAKSITVNKDENGLHFQTSSFSPFVLVYDTKAEEPVPETVTVTFKSGEHGDFGWPYVTSKDVEVTEGGHVNRADIPTVYPDKGYEFIGWYKQGESYHLYTSYAVSQMPITEDTTFIAQYRYVGGESVDDEYDVVYNANFTDGGVPRRQGYDKGETVTVSENKWFERDGYIFVGWNTEADGTGDSYDPDDTFKMPGRDVYLYAQWQKEKPGPDDTGVSRWLETEDHNAYLTGYPDSTFGADRNMTRAEVAQMFYALLKNKNVMITTSFSDVSNDAWYATAVKTMASLGMMSGYPDGTFRPDEPITRAEFATVALAFAYEPDNARCSYLDVSTSAWYYTYVAQATTYGWIGGYPDGTFRPNNSITRVEVCVIVNNMLGRTPDEDYIDRNEDELVNFVDLSDRYWGYYTIMEATNGHEYTGNYSNEAWESVK